MRVACPPPFSCTKSSCLCMASTNFASALVTLSHSGVIPVLPGRLEQVMATLAEIIVPLTGREDLVEQVRTVHKMVHTDVLKLVAQELAVCPPPPGGRSDGLVAAPYLEAVQLENYLFVP